MKVATSPRPLLPRRSSSSPYATAALILLLLSPPSPPASALGSEEYEVGTDGTRSPLPAASSDTPSHGDSTPYPHFLAHNQTRTCAGDEHAKPFNNQIRGVNLGGWMVLEPWITPSMFYQFLDGNETSAAFDMYTFCRVLGPGEGNAQLRRHWDAWVTEDVVRELADSGAVNSLRLPVGDWQYKPYGPYVGCTDGANDYVEKLLDWADEYGLSVLIDVHGMRGSQNGFDNSGMSSGVQWTSTINVYPRGLTTFQHWPIRSAGWMGKFNAVSTGYDYIDRYNIDHSLDVLEEIVRTYSGHPAVMGLQPVNEPWEYTPIDELKKFYWEGYLVVKRGAPYWKYIMHDSFRFDADVWGGFMNGCPDRALDTHIYQAWDDPASRYAFYADACAQKRRIAEMERSFGPVVVGEWSLATDNCAMWLNGFNDNLPGFPRVTCKYVKCSEPYMGREQPGTPVDPAKPIQGPYGTGMSGPTWGLCPVGRDWMKERNRKGGGGPEDAWIRAPPQAPRHMDDTDAVMTQLALKKISAFSGIGHGFYFWNFRTELDEPHWSYVLALGRGWIPRGNLNSALINNACRKEDAGLYVCVCKRGQLESNVRNSIKYCYRQEGKTDEDVEAVDELSGEDLYDLADDVFNKFWTERSMEGATCDFGGIATLQEMNRTASDSTDDDYFYYGGGGGSDMTGMVLKLFWTLVVGLAAGSFVGFLLAMRLNRGFNRSITRKLSKTRLGSRLRNSRVFSATFAVDPDYSEIPSTEIKNVGDDGRPVRYD